MNKKVEKICTSGLLFILLILMVVILGQTFICEDAINVAAVAIVLAGICSVISFQNYRSSRELSRLAYVDSLTGGNNKNKFKLLAAKALVHNREQLYMVRMDVDDFKLINDMYGYKEGNYILLLMNKIIGEMLSNMDVYGRVGNDIYLCLICISTDEEVIELGRRFRTRFKEELESLGKHYTVNFTTGIYNNC